MPSTGASDDLLKATAIARAMVTRYGMDDTLGEMSYEPEPSAYGDGAMASLQPRDHGEATAREIDCAVRDLVSRASARALDLLGSERARLVAGAEALLEQETLSAEELRALVFGSGVPEGDSGRPEQSERNAVERAENEGLATCAPTP
jgi:cell division protease FtsH